jgi:hypothetical protein
MERFFYAQKIKKSLTKIKKQLKKYVFYCLKVNYLSKIINKICRKLVNSILKSKKKPLFTRGLEGIYLILKDININTFKRNTSKNNYYLWFIIRFVSETQKEG